MTITQARADIFRQIKLNLGINPLNYTLFNEELNGNRYTLTLLSANIQNCVLASCNDITNKQALAVIISF